MIPRAILKLFLKNIFIALLRDEILTKNIFMEDSAESLPKEDLATRSTEDSRQDDDIFYDSQVDEKETLV